MSGPASSTRPILPLEAPLDTTVHLPGSKSITNRALVAAALASGPSELDGVLFADDTEAMLDCLATLGAGIETDVVGERAQVRGTGGHLRPGPLDLDARLSGTTSRFVLPLLPLGEGAYRLDGGPPLRARPTADGIEALRALGASVDEVERPGHLPVLVHGARANPDDPALPSRVRLRGDASSQFLSGLLLAAPPRPSGLRIEVDGPLVSAPYVAMTVAVMAAFGVVVERPDRSTYVVPPSSYAARSYRIEPDASAASYFFAAAAIAGGRVRVDGLGRGSLQGDLAFVDVLERMGARVTRGADFTEVAGGATLRGVSADLRNCSDTAQTLAVTAVFADRPTEVTGIGFIRRKETDRLAAVVAELRRAGIEAAETDDGFVVHPGRPRPAVIETYDDHRMAMSFALLGLRTPGIEIADPGCVAKTFPGFFEALDALRDPPGHDRPNQGIG